MLRLFQTGLVSACVAVLSACATPAAHESTPTPSRLDGKWEGDTTSSFVPVRSGRWDWTEHQHFSLTISGNKVALGTTVDGKPYPIDLPFTVTQVDTNAVILSMRADEKGDWVEAYAFFMTLLDSSHLEVTWHRQVNNRSMKRSDASAAYDIFGYGMLSKSNGPQSE